MPYYKCLINKAELTLLEPVILRWRFMKPVVTANSFASSLNRERSVSATVEKISVSHLGNGFSIKIRVLNYKAFQRQSVLKLMRMGFAKCRRTLFWRRAFLAFRERGRYLVIAPSARVHVVKRCGPYSLRRRHEPCTQ